MFVCVFLSLYVSVFYCVCVCVYVSVSARSKRERVPFNDLEKTKLINYLADTLSMGCVRRVGCDDVLFLNAAGCVTVVQRG